MKTEISKQDAVKYLERKSFPGWDAFSNKPNVTLEDVMHLIDLIYSKEDSEEELEQELEQEISIDDEIDTSIPLEDVLDKLKKLGVDTSQLKIVDDEVIDEQRVKQLVDKLSYLIDACENDFEAMVFNPDGTFELLLECHAALSAQINET